VEGKVVNSLTGEPIHKAELTLTTSLIPDGLDAIGFDVAAMMDPDDTGKPAADAKAAAPKPKEPKRTYAASSDNAGKFRLEGIIPGDYFLQVKHAGFGDQNYKPSRAVNAGGRLHLTAGQEVHDVEFRLVPHGAVSGTVVDEDGDPLAGAMVSASMKSFSAGRRMLVPVDSIQSNDRGEFRLGKLPPGHYYLSAELMNMNPMAAVPPPPKDGSPETGYVATYFPQATDVDAAEPLDVKAGADLPGFVIHMRKSRVVRVSGNVVGADGKPLAHTQIVLMSGMRPGSMRMASADADGKFEIANVSPGTYTATTVRMTGSAPSMTMQTVVVPGENLTDVKLGTAPQGSLQGRITVAGDNKVALNGLMVMMDGTAGGIFIPPVGRADESGAFTVKKVSPGSYEVNIRNVPAGSYLKSVLWNGKEQLGRAVDLSAGVSGDLQVILGVDGGAFDAKVVEDDKPLNDATVVLLPEDAASRSEASTRSESTDDSGHVAFQDVPPGKYLVFAWEQVEDGDWFDPAFVKAATTYATRVTIAPRDKQHVDLKAIPAK
jgi:hypothetical protein